MGEYSLSARAIRGVALVFGICLGVWLAAQLVGPLLPLLGALVFLVALGHWLFRGPRAR
jgi:hypothetical protein